jgi:hypothetical protein
MERVMACCWQKDNIQIEAISKIPQQENYTCDIRTSTWRVGDSLLHNRGHLTVLDHFEFVAVAAKYPVRPGLCPETCPINTEL